MEALTSRSERCLRLAVFMTSTVHHATLIVKLIVWKVSVRDLGWAAVT